MNPNKQSENLNNPPLPSHGIIPATAGTEQVSSVKRWLPRLIIGAILINLIPDLFALFNQRELGETIRNYANIAFIIGFLIIIFKTLSERK